VPHTLAQLLAQLDTVPVARLIGEPTRQISVTDVTLDSRMAGPGVLFACRPGARVDGHDFAAAAVAAGSPALLVERELDLPVPQLLVTSVAQAVGPVAAAVHGHPSEGLLLLGVTGTNGKTTTTYLLESILRTAGHATGLVGTVQTLVAGESVPGVRTTPEAPDLQRLLARMRAAGVTAAAMEVSSHGLSLGRVRGTRLAAAVFTNLSQDHLDFHADLEDYFAAKAKLFAPELTALSVINVDDAWGRVLAGSTATEIVRVSPTGAIAADVSAAEVVVGHDGSTFTAVMPTGSLAVRTRLPGLFNVANALQAVAATTALGIAPEAAAAGVAALRGVPGRMEPVEAGQPFSVLVDYAHTPDSVENVLIAARGLTRGRVLVLLGCGGDRDRGKRPLMGRTAATLADIAVLTSDNPRSEDPAAILAAMVTGAREAGAAGRAARWHVQPDRRAAIAEILDEAGPGDVVVLAGKGHEPYQELASERVDFDDRLVAREILAELGFGQRGDAEP